MNLGDKVIIKECHKIPDLVGKEAEIIALVKPEMAKYPIQVELTEPIKMETPFGTLETKGPFPFREDELELVNPNKGIPGAFLSEA